MKYYIFVIMGIKDLDTVVNEMDVQDRYRVAFRNAFKDIIFKSDYGTDGIAYSEKNKLTMIVEQKYGYDFMGLKDRARAVSQVIKYIKTIHDTDATKVPKVVVMGWRFRGSGSGQWRRCGRRVIPSAPGLRSCEGRTRQF